MTRRRSPKRPRGGLILLAALALALALGPAGPSAAAPPQIDPSILPRQACGTPSPGDFDYWCGLWSTDAPTPLAGSSQSAIAPLGLVSFERVFEADVRPLNERDFGAFNFRLNECSGSSVPTLFYAGRYAQGTVLACASSGGSVLGGYWREDSGSRSGKFTITTRSLRGFDGQLIQYFLANNQWTGRCVGGWCVTAVPPTSTPTPAAPSQGIVSAGARDGVVGNTAFAAGGAVVGCGAGVLVFGASFLNPLTWGTLPIQGQILAAICASAAVAGAGGGAVMIYDSAVKEVNDPRFPHSRLATSREAGVLPAGSQRAAAAGGAGIALPPARLRLIQKAGLVRSCRRERDRAGCTRLAAAAARFLSAQAVVASLMEATAIAGSRFAGAAARGDAEAQALQAAVIKVYSGALASALPDQTTSGLALAQALRRAGKDVRLTPARARRSARLLARLQNVPGSVVARLQREGFSRNDLRRALGSAVSIRDAGRTLSLGAALSRRVPTSGLASAYRSITPVDVEAIVRGLSAQGALGPQVAGVLLGDLERLRLAPAAERGSAARQLAADVRQAGGRHGLFLELAVEPLI